MGGDDKQADYRLLFDAIKGAIEDEKAILANKGLSYAHNAYFKSAKARYDLNRALEFVETQW